MHTPPPVNISPIPEAAAGEPSTPSTSLPEPDSGLVHGINISRPGAKRRRVPLRLPSSGDDRGIGPGSDAADDRSGRGGEHKRAAGDHKRTDREVGGGTKRKRGARADDDDVKKDTRQPHKAAATAPRATKKAKAKSKGSSSSDTPLYGGGGGHGAGKRPPAESVEVSAYAKRKADKAARDAEKCRLKRAANDPRYLKQLTFPQDIDDPDVIVDHCKLMDTIRPCTCSISLICSSNASVIMTNRST